MSIASRNVRKLALLVGSNPLPNYIAALVLNPSEIVLLYTPETKEPFEHLNTAFKELPKSVSPVSIEYATNAYEIRDRCRSLSVDHLHYSGGTKVMAAHARMACNLEDKNASYLDERNGVLRFDDGVDIRLEQCNLNLTLDLLLKLHGIKREHPTAKKEGSPTDHDVEEMAAKIIGEQGTPGRVDLAKTLYDLFRPSGKPMSLTEAQRKPWTAGEYGISLSLPKIPADGWNADQYEKWDKFITGEWFEIWTSALIRSCLADSSLAVEVGVHCNRTKPCPTEFEIDVAFVRGHRLYIVSCTTDQTKARCKSKLFEVAMRARQMGGDLARSALVCLLDGRDKKGPYVDQLRNDVASLWESPNKPQVFGLENLREWIGVNGEPNLITLKDWIEA